MNESSLPPVEELAGRVERQFRQWRVPALDIEVAWNRRLATTAGRAFVRRGRIELNPRLLCRQPDQIESVLIHEAAHVAAFRLFGENIPAHGRHWRSLMRLAGQEPAVTHRMPVDALRRSRPAYLYLRMCGACGERTLLRQVRYGRCGQCSRRDDYLVIRARANDAGRRALQRMSDAEVRAQFD